jgi:hypothetical protein
MKITRDITVFVLLAFVVSCAPKKIFYLNEITPPQMQCAEAAQEMSGPPPILRPTGKRKIIRPLSQYFYLAIPNAMDPSGRAHDLQRSIADMLYTELFKTKRFNLLDRKALVNLDPEWLIQSLKHESAYSEGSQAKKKDSKIEEKKEEGKPVDEKESIKYDDRTQQLDKAMIELEETLSKADGILLMYITNRVGMKKGGVFDIDFRIVSMRFYQETVLFADSQKVKYQASTTEEIIYDRKDIEEISNKILEKFPSPHYEDKNRPRIIKCDPPIIVINQGTRDNLIKGLLGYVVTIDESVRNGNQERAPHFSYLAEFVVTEVFAETCTAFLLPPYDFETGNRQDDYQWDVRSDDVVVFK